MGGVKEFWGVDLALSYVVREDVSDIIQKESLSWYDRMLRAIESSALFVWFLRWCFWG